MRDQIMHAAAELFSANGYPGTSVGAIAEAVQISPAALYWHFEGKEALLVELCDEAIDSYEHRLDEALEGLTDTAEQLRMLAVAHSEAVLTDPKVARGTLFSAYTLVHSISTANYRRLHERQRHQLERWRRVVDAGIQRGEFHVADSAVTVFAVTDMCEAVGSWASLDGALTPQEIAAEYGEFALRVVGYGLPDSAPRRQKPRGGSRSSAPDARPSSHDKETDGSLRETVLHESAALFRAKGFAGTSVGDIARAAKMSPASLYWHFSSKEHLLYELVTTALDDYDRFVEAELEGVVGGQARMLAFARGHVLSIFDDPSLSDVAVAHTFRDLARSLSPEHFTEIRERLLAQLKRCREIIIECSGKGGFGVEHPTLAAQAVLDMCDAAANWYDPNGRYPVEWVVDEYAEFALRIAGYRLAEAGQRRRFSATAGASRSPEIG
jgi:AcrR family transcriptional regulator